MKYGFFRAACANPSVIVADCDSNAQSIISLAKEAASNGAQLIVFPELSVTAYTCGDLFHQRTLLEEAAKSLERIAFETSGLNSLIAVGVPVTADGALYNCAALLFRGDILAFVPKSYLPVYSEFYERRQFTPAQRTPFANTAAGTASCSQSAAGSPMTSSIQSSGSIYLTAAHPAVPFGTDILISDKSNPLFVLGTEICEDVWVPVPPSTKAALAGATVIANLSASNEIIGKAEYRRLLISSQSAKICAGYVYADSANGESTTDMVFASHNLIAENGTMLAESKLFEGSITYADIDLERIAQERIRTTTFADCRRDFASNCYRIITIDSSTTSRRKNKDTLLRVIDPHPFVPSDTAARAERCRAVIDLQAQGLAKRLRHTHAQSAVIGLSGGLDSTLALLVTVRAFNICSLDTAGIRAVTMPCFGTTDRTYTNACTLAKESKTTLIEIPIAESVRKHFADIGQDENVHDVTYENCQARERTQVLMDIANKTNGLVIGTGDLSEQALGWATYNGDHMSMYGVNGSIPKTLVRYLVRQFADEADSTASSSAAQNANTGHNPQLAAVLRDILATPVSPELLPPDGKTISQKTEDIVGPYELHDFFLYYFLRYGFTPEKIQFLAEQAFIEQPAAKGDTTAYDKTVISTWLSSFYKRFFSQQFKRSCMPDGAKVGTVNLSPRGDWRMPSDASSAMWLKSNGIF
jgi:NAD+ synthase (glutamine-hydrolysing)